MNALPALLSALTLGTYGRKAGGHFKKRTAPPKGRTVLFHKRGPKPQFRKKFATVPVVRNDGQGNQVAGHKIGRKVGKLSTVMEKKIRYALQPQNSQLFKDAGRIVASTGTCTYATFPLNGIEDLATLVNSGQATSTDDALPNKEGRVHIKDSSLNVSFTNMDAGLVQIRVYEWIVRRDIPTSQIDLNTMVVQGFQQQNGTGATVTEYQDASTTLFNNPLWCSYVKITKVRNVMLGTGKSFKLSLNQQKGRDVNPIIFGADGARDILAMAHYTRGYVIQVIGQNVSDSANPANVTIGPVHLAYTQERRYHWSQPWSGTSEITTTGSFGTITASANLMSTSGNGNVIAENSA